MSSQRPPGVTRRCDVAIVGGSVAGLAAGLQIQRQDRSVIVIDSGEPRNAPAARAHGYLGYDGAAPGEIVAAGRAELRRYGGEVFDASVANVDWTGDEFSLDVGRLTVRARRVVAATGVIDELPSVAGLAEHWGETVLHCPFCHGYEFRGRRLAQIVTQAASLQPARLFAHLAGQLTLVVSADLDVGAAELGALEAAGVDVTRNGVEGITEGPEGRLSGLTLTDGRQLAVDAVVVTPYLRPRVEPFVGLGVTVERHPLGVADFVATAPTGETSVQGLYAVGNLTDPSQQLLAAAASASQVGAMVALDLAREDQSSAGHRAPSELEWNERYAGDQIWSGEPNGTLVAEVESLTPGRALDIGSGEGGDALWLAEHGWSVTATDVANAALERLGRDGHSRGLELQLLTTDANAWRAFSDDTYDLVTIFYSAIPKTGDDRAIANILAAVSPGGTLLMVGHPRQGPAPWDREAVVDLGDVEAALRSSPDDWAVLASEVRDRPPGSSSHHHHDQDVVLRAQRREP